MGGLLAYGLVMIDPFEFSLAAFLAYGLAIIGLIAFILGPSFVLSLALGQLAVDMLVSETGNAFAATAFDF